MEQLKRPDYQLKIDVVNTTNLLASYPDFDESNRNSYYLIVKVAIACAVQDYPIS